MTEYGLILATIAGASVAAVSLMGHSISGNLDNFTAVAQASNVDSLLGTKFGEVTPILRNGFFGPNASHNPGVSSSSSHPGGSNNSGQGSDKSSSTLGLIETNGNGTNASSAEGTRDFAKSYANSVTVAQDLKKLADQTKSPILGGLSQQALMSAANQATYQVISNPSGAYNEQLMGMKQVATQNYTDKELRESPDRILSSIGQWTENMEAGKTKILADPKLSNKDKAAAVSMLDLIINSTREAYGAERLSEITKTVPRLDDSQYINSKATFDTLRSEAKKVLNSDAAGGNTALKASLTGGVALDENTNP